MNYFTVNMLMNVTVAAQVPSYKPYCLPLNVLHITAFWLHYKLDQIRQRVFLCLRHLTAETGVIMFRGCPSVPFS